MFGENGETGHHIDPFVFGMLAVCGSGGAVLCLRRALKVATERDGELKMFGWAALALLGLVIAGVSSAYILIPIFM